MTARIDPSRHPLLHEVATGAQWVGTDEFPSCLVWADEHEAWLRFLQDTGGLSHYMPRLKGLRQRRDEAFAEATAAWTRQLESIIHAYWFQWFAFQPFSPELAT